MHRHLSIAAGKPYPLGATVYPEGANFSLFTKYATAVELLLFDYVDDAQPSYVFRLDPAVNRTFYYWHVFVPGLAAGHLAAVAFTNSFSTDQFPIVAELRPASYAGAALAMAVVVGLSLLPAVRAIRRIDVAATVRERAT